MRRGLACQLLGEPFDIVAAAPRVDDAVGVGLLPEKVLGIDGDALREVGRQRERLVECIGVQALRLALGRGHRLDAGADDVVEHVLGGQAPAAGLTVGAERQALWVLGIERLDDLRPQHARGAHLGDFHQDILADRPEERQARGEIIDFHAGRDAGPQVFETVGQRVAELEIGGGAGFLHVVAGDADAVEHRHVLTWCI